MYSVQQRLDVHRLKDWQQAEFIDKIRKVANTDEAANEYSQTVRYEAGGNVYVDCVLSYSGYEEYNFIVWLYLEDSIYDEIDR